MWLIAGIGLAVLILSWFGYRATQEWRRSSSLLVQRRAEQKADLLVTALMRDMRGVEDSILRGVRWDDVSLERPYEIGDLIASAFARYPYPEAFFGWRSSPADAPVLVFTRADRRPAWLPADDQPERFPVTIVRDAATTRRIIDRLVEGAAQGHRFKAFETQLADRPYQVVARLLYLDSRRDRLEGVFGFVVNLDWAERLYFPALAEAVARIAGADLGLKAAILDESRAVVTGAPAAAADSTVVERSLGLFFFDPSLMALDPSEDLPSRQWTVQVSAEGDPTVAVSYWGADRLLAVAAAATIALSVGLLLTARALRASADLARLRSDFVSSVTHDLRTPLSTIRMVSETLARGRVRADAQVRQYAQVLDQEAKRLGRLVDNMLAYSRVTDVSDVYSFEPLALADVVDDVLRGFQPQFTHQGFEVEIDIPADLPPVKADRTALGLVLDNLVDNAIRYSAERRWVGVSARRDGRMVEVRVADHGIGIPADEIGRVERRFLRGRHAKSHGSGLGLAIASRIVGDHGGRLFLTSQIDEGTTVHVTLPLVETG
jgi:signal transduction histidine kinase